MPMQSVGSPLIEPAILCTALFFRHREPRNYTYLRSCHISSPILNRFFHLVIRVLLTAFEPYDRWPDNASWLALIDLTRWHEGPIELVTRRYPVELGKMSERLRTDLQENYDLAIHCGQAPGSPRLRLESIGLNVRTDGSEILSGAPAAYRSPLPLESAALGIREAGIPASVSYHAGTYLCNSVLFLSQHYAGAFGMRTESAFVHMPLAPAQVARENSDSASMSTPMVSAALAIMIAVFSQRCGSRGVSSHAV